MSDRLTGTLRETFERLAAEGNPPAGLARAALAGARRRRRVEFAAAAGVVLCLALAGVAVARQPDTPTEVADAPRGSVVVTYSGIQDPPTKWVPNPVVDRSLLLDQKRGTYRAIPYPVALPSPDGDRVLVAQGDNTAKFPRRVGIMDRATGRVRWIENGQVPGFPSVAGTGAWSPDGRHILFRHQLEAGRSGAVLVDTETLRARFVPVPDLAERTIGVGGLVWTPDSDGFAVTLTESPGATADGVAFYDLDGSPLRTLVRADAALSSAPAFSPDGDRMALSGPADVGSLAIVDAATGALQARVPLPRPAKFAGWTDDDHLLIRVFHDNGTEQLQVIDLQGRVTKRLSPPDGIFAGAIGIGPATGLPATADGLRF